MPLVTTKKMFKEAYDGGFIYSYRTANYKLFPIASLVLH